MRRPAPLPSSSPREPEPTAPVARARTASPARAASAASVARSQPADADATQPLDPIPLIPAAEPAGEPAARPLTQRDIWRAARARRRALKTEIKRFTQRSRKRRMIWAASLGVVVVLVGGSALAAYSPLFAVRDIDITGTSALSADAVESALSDQMGTPLALIDANEIKAALVGFPLIETYSLEAAPPHTLTVRIVERTPVGVVSSDAGFTLVDAAGVVLSTTPERPGGQPLLEIAGGPGSDAFTSAGLIVRSLPADLRSQLTEVHASSEAAVELRLGAVSVMWGGAERSPEKVRILATLMSKRPDATRFDVSAPNAVVAG